MLNTGDIVRVYEHPYSDHSYLVGEVTRTTSQWVYCESLTRVRGGQPIPLQSHIERFKTPVVGLEASHDKYRARLGRPPRLVRLAATSNRPVWQPSYG